MGGKLMLWLIGIVTSIESLFQACLIMTSSLQMFLVIFQIQLLWLKSTDISYLLLNGRFALCLSYPVIFRGNRIIYYFLDRHLQWLI